MDFGYILYFSLWDFLMVWIFLRESKKRVSENIKFVRLGNWKCGVVIY